MQVDQSESGLGAAHVKREPVAVWSSSFVTLSPIGPVSGGCTLSMAVTKAEHQVEFTNKWRKAIPYGPGGTAIATRAEVEQVARQIYAQYPSILRALGF
jgi:hypothetical protein